MWTEISECGRFVYRQFSLMRADCWSFLLLPYEPKISSSGLWRSCFLRRSGFVAGAGETDLALFGGAKWTFYPGYEFPGAKGASRIETVDDRNALVLAYDFTGGGVCARRPGRLVEIQRARRNCSWT